MWAITIPSSPTSASSPTASTPTLSPLFVQNLHSDPLQIEEIFITKPSGAAKVSLHNATTSLKGNPNRGAEIRMKERRRSGSGGDGEEVEVKGAGGSYFKNGVNKLADLVGVTLGPKGKNVVLESKYGSSKIVNDGVTVAKEVELEDPVENIGAKLGLIVEGFKVVAAGANPVQITRGIEKAGRALVTEIKSMSKEVEDSELANVAVVSAGMAHTKKIVTREETNAQQLKVDSSGNRFPKRQKVLHQSARQRQRQWDLPMKLSMNWI
ncbi:hypothetical protein Sjap_012896 [Stephania japonica]|uniref:Uncharacterized protein n=1 Tax=Stephania japonica TaxID=461633 RepID=A0AAP0NYQ2_9MAGN